MREKRFVRHGVDRLEHLASFEQRQRVSASGYHQESDTDERNALIGFLRNATSDKQPRPLEQRVRFMRQGVDRLQRLASLNQPQVASAPNSLQESDAEERSALISFLRNAAYAQQQQPTAASAAGMKTAVLARISDRDSHETTPADTAELQRSSRSIEPTIIIAQEPRPLVAAEPVMEHTEPIAEDPEERERSEPMEPTIIYAEETRYDEPAEPADAIADESSASEIDSDTANTDQGDEGDESSETPDLNEDGLKSICEVTLDIRPEEGELPRDLAAVKFQKEGEVRHLPGTNRPWPLYEFWWEAPAFCHRPLYFEEVNLERYGYSHGLAQPLLSGAHFFGKIPALPYLMTAEPHRDCVHTLGHYPPGSYAPYHIHYPPLSLRAAAVEAAVVTGLIFAIP